MKQFLVTSKIIEQNGTVIDHAAERIIDNRDLDTVSQKLHDSAAEAELAKLVGGWCDENVAPVQITMLKLILLLGDGESQCGLERKRTKIVIKRILQNRHPHQQLVILTNDNKNKQKK